MNLWMLSSSPGKEMIRGSEEQRAGADAAVHEYGSLLSGF
jgi:hypothetical protein